MKLDSLDYLTADTYNICCFIIIGLIIFFIGNGKKGNLSSFIMLGIIVALFPFTMPYTGQAINMTMLKEDYIVKENPKLYYSSPLQPITSESTNCIVADDGYEFIFRPANLQQLSLINRWGGIVYYKESDGNTKYLTNKSTIEIEYTDKEPYIEVYKYRADNKFQNYLLNNPRTFGSPVLIKLYINNDSQIIKDFSFSKSILTGKNFKVN